MPKKTLREIIINDISVNGPMNVGRYMTLCLSHPTHGYYTASRPDPFGAEGDFTTAPEISQLFGETIAAWVVQTWDALGRPDQYSLIECGPGRGTLMADVLRTLQKLEALPECYQGANVSLLEISPTLKARQREALKLYDVSWIENLEDLNHDSPVIMIGNEFLDALPVRQAIYTVRGWQERKVTVRDGALAFCEVALGVQDDTVIPDAIQSVPYGTVFEFSPARDQFTAAVCQCLRVHGGAALMIDYGELEHTAGKSLHAIQNHSHVDVLEHSGNADLSANVDFKAIESVALEYALNVETMEQGAFLEAYGIKQRVQALIKSQEERKSGVRITDEAEKALQRLTHSDQMGQRFKVMSIWGNKAVL